MFSKLTRLFSKQKKWKQILNERPPIKVFDLSNHIDLKPICDRLVNDEIYVDDQFPIIKLEPEKLWTADPTEDRRWHFRLHSFITVELLLKGYEQLGERRYLDKAVEMSRHWSQHHFPDSQERMAWHDHSTALRLIVICRLFEQWRQVEWDDKLADRMMEWVKKHAGKLADPGFYMENHNHGLDQDMALYVASIVFNFLPEAEDWHTLALERFWKQMEHLFAEDGSYREHSPQYTLIFIDRLLKFAHFLKGKDDRHYDRLMSGIKKQMRFLTHILQPDGQLPALGDTITQPAQRPLYHPPREEFAQLEYVFTKGKAGEAPQELDALFPDGGYAVFRNKWPFDEETMQVVFYGSFHSRVHKHGDDLAITLFAHRQPLLMDAGMYKYDYNSEERSYVISTRAHNTVTVDGADTDLKRLNIGKSGLTDYYSSPTFSMAAGAHCLYPGVIHQRLVCVLKPHETVVLDWLRGYKEHRFDLHFLFYPTLTCEKKEQSIRAARDGEPLLVMEPLLQHDRLQVNLVRGEKDPWRGWCSVEYGQLVPAWQAVYTLTGPEGRFATHLNTRPHQKQLTRFHWEKDAVQISWRNAAGEEETAVIIWGREHIYLALNGRMQEVRHLDQPLLKEAIEEAPKYEYREKYRLERERRIRWQQEVEQLKGKNEA